MFKRAAIIPGLLVMIMFITNVAHAQSLRQAEKHFNSLAYALAIDEYEAALKKKVAGPTRITALKNLGESYMKVQDGTNAERVFRELASLMQDFSGANSKYQLLYAQALASNGKYKESQEQYNKFLEGNEADSRGKGFSKLYNDISVINKNSACYKVDYLTINTNSSDFSPTKYQNGLIFVSNRSSSNGLRRVYNWNNTPFLDLFHLEDVSMLSSSGGSLGGGSKSSKGSRSSGGGGVVGEDEYTSPTANDTKTIGTFGSKNISSGFGFGDKAQTESDKLKGSINTKLHEGPAAFFKDGSKLLFTRNNSNGNKGKKSSDGIVKLKLYMGEAQKEGWGKVTELPFNSDEYSTGHPALSPDEKLVFFCSDMPGGFGGTDIYAVRYDGSSWSAPINLGKEVNTKGNEMFPTVDDKGNLYFASDGLPGLGGLDIFFTQLEGTAQKGRVTNLGAPVNSSKDDFGFMTDGERKNGYFSSNRKRGGDDDDIYKFERTCELKEGCELIIAVFDAESKMPLDNAKVNYKDEDGNSLELFTDADGLIALDNVKVGFEYSFVASRDGYETRTVAYKTDECDNEPSRLEIPLERPKPKAADSSVRDTTNRLQKCKLKARVAYQSDRSRPIPNVTVTLMNSCDGSTTTAVSNEEGLVEFMGTETCDYTIDAKKEGMGSRPVSITRFSCANTDQVHDILMFTTGDTIRIENIYFDYGKYYIRRDARVGLDKLVKLMRQYPNMKIELGSHTDSRSETDFNQTLSDNRAKSSSEYLFKRGISRSRVTFKGYGETQLVNKCADGVKCSEADHQLNRRTEFKILSLD
ncbi:MAG: OmpA family protein [Leadbetterella sp.]